MMLLVPSNLLRYGILSLLLTTSLYNSSNLASSFSFPLQSLHHHSQHQSHPPKREIHPPNDNRKQSHLASTPSDTPPPTTLTLDPKALIARAKIAFATFDQEQKGFITPPQLSNLLTYLDLDTTPEERSALFLYLDHDRDGTISLSEFITWYSDAAEAVTAQSQEFQLMLTSRRTVNSFDSTPVDDKVLRRAVQCAIAAPNRSGSEPWRFVKIGEETVARLQELNDRVVMAGGDEVLRQQQQAPLLPDVWSEIPGWCVVTTKITPGDPETELKDFRSTSCAMQNFMLSMWSEGVGSKWSEGPTQKTQQFADIVEIDTEQEKVVGIIWYGFTKGGLSSADP